jgi:hypothetical protein
MEISSLRISFPVFGSPKSAPHCETTIRFAKGLVVPLHGHFLATPLQTWFWSSASREALPRFASAPFLGARFSG